MALYSPTNVKNIINVYDFKVAKKYGQNFLVDKNIIDKIVESIDIREEDLIVEIGPGLGVLTREICDLAKQVIAIEIDEKLLPILNSEFKENENLQIISDDFLRIDLEELANAHPGKNVKYVGNLPYYITTPIIMKILESKIPYSSLTIMVQKEVGDRLLASAGTKNYGAISVACQYYADVIKITDVSREVFYPKPNVDSSVIQLKYNKDKIKVHNERFYFECVRASFSQRRKMISNSLSTVNGITREDVIDVLDRLSIQPARRAETISPQEFADISNALQKMKDI